MKIFTENKLAIDFIVSILKQNKSIIYKYIFFIVITSLLALVLPYISKLEIDQLSSKANDFF